MVVMIQNLNHLKQDILKVAQLKANANSRSSFMGYK